MFAILVAFLALFSIFTTGRAQRATVALGESVDTADAETRDVLALWEDYLGARPDTMWSPCWQQVSTAVVAAAMPLARARAASPFSR